MDENSLARAESELSGWADPATRLREAIDNNQFELFCQPMVSLGGEGGFPMAEVLVRMREEERALLPPGEFLPVMEHFRMMPQLDRWVVRNVIAHLKAGSRMPRFTINLSGQTLGDPEFVPYVAGALASAAVRPDALAFEIDESDTLAHQPAVEQFVTQYSALGGKILIDGFGRRSVSIKALKALGAQIVKIDGSIVRKVLSSEVALTKLNAILKIGEALDFACVAECVEEQDILVRLKALGVEYAQGFGIHQPQSIGNFAKTAA